MNVYIQLRYFDVLLFQSPICGLRYAEETSSEKRSEPNNL